MLSNEIDALNRSHCFKTFRNSFGLKPIMKIRCIAAAGSWRTFPSFLQCVDLTAPKLPARKNRLRDIGKLYNGIKYNIEPRFRYVQFRYSWFHFGLSYTIPLCQVTPTRHFMTVISTHPSSFGHGTDMSPLHKIDIYATLHVSEHSLSLLVKNGSPCTESSHRA